MTTVLRPQETDEVYSLAYGKDTIVVNRQEHGKEDTEPLILFSSDGEYYYNTRCVVHKVEERVLFLSTKRDTVVKINDDLLAKYEIEIKQLPEGTYQTTNYLITPSGRHKTVTYYYDADYHIIKIEKNSSVVYQ